MHKKYKEDTIQFCNFIKDDVYERKSKQNNQCLKFGSTLNIVAIGVTVFRHHNDTSVKDRNVRFISINLSR